MVSAGGDAPSEISDAVDRPDRQRQLPNEAIRAFVPPLLLPCSSPYNYPKTHGEECCLEIRFPYWYGFYYTSRAMRSIIILIVCAFHSHNWTIICSTFITLRGTGTPSLR